MPSANTLDNLYNNATLLLDANLRIKNAHTSPPDNIVANWRCTRLYPHASWRGRFWRLIGWATGLRTVFLHATIQRTIIAFKNHLDVRNKDLDSIDSPGYMGNWWKSKKLDQMLAKARVYHRGSEAISLREEQINRIGKIVRWAFYKQQDEAPLQQAYRAVITPEARERAAKLENKLNEVNMFKVWWDKLNLGCSVETLYRELVFCYPKNDETLDLYAQSLVVDNERCREPDIIYGPLLHLAAVIAYSDGIKIKELETELKELVVNVKQHNLEILMTLVYRLRSPKKRYDLSKVPPGALRLIEKGRLSACTFDGATGQKTNSWGEPRRVRRVRAESKSFLASLTGHKPDLVEESVRPKYFQFPQYFKYQDGTGKIITTKKYLGEF